MKIVITSVFVDDQEEAKKFYTEVLGFKLKHDMPLGEFKWLTVVSPDDPDGVELLLEPSDNPATKVFKKAIFEQGIAAAAFGVEDIEAEYKRLKAHGVHFTMPPTSMGEVKMAVFDDTCGNLIQIAQKA